MVIFQKSAFLQTLKIEHLPRATLLIGAAFAFLILIVLISIVLLENTRRERDRLVQTIDIQGQLDELAAALRRMESGQRGYLLTGDPDF